jgi:putative oxidoreductase
MRGIVPVGRALFALLFITSIFGHLSDAGIAHAAAHGVPVANILVPLAGVVALAGGVMVMLGYRARFGAFLLVLFLVPVTLIMHRFWGLPDPRLAQLQQVMFLKNLSLVGAAMMIMYWGSGPYSLDT